jgi:PAS domain S-box-containing protein
VAALRAAVHGRDNAWKAEYRFRKHDGSYAEVLDRGLVVRDENQRPMRVIGSMLDLTERHSAEAEREHLIDKLAHEEARLKATLEQIPAGILIAAAPSGKIIFGNARCKEILGQQVFPMEDVAAYGKWGLRHPGGGAYAPEELPMHRALARGEVTRGEEMEFSRPGESALILSVNSAPIRDRQGEIKGAVTAFEAITARKRAEAELKASHARFEIPSQISSDLLMTGDSREFIRKTFERLSPFLGTDICLHYLIEEGGDALRLDFSSGIPDASADPLARLEMDGDNPSPLTRRSRLPQDLPRAEDQVFAWLRRLGARACICHPLLVQGRLLGILAFASRTRARFEPDDLWLLETTCNQAASAMERLRLIAVHSERAEDLALADRRKDEFLAMLAHELRNPLAPIRHAADILGFASDTDPRLAWSREVIHRQIAHLTRLVDDLLEVSRITSGKIQLRKTLADLTAVASGAADMARPLIESRRHTLHLDITAEPLIAEVDPTRITQVIGNLLNNAVKYTDEGGQIWLSARREGDEAVIQVRDSGIGIPTDLLPHVFDLFSQADRSLDRAQGGLGVGLTLVHRLVTLHGGSVLVRSEGAGKGSEFSVRIPLRQEAQPASQHERAAPPANGPCRRILVVDDNVDAADSLTLLLKLAGHRVRTAYDGPTALESARDFLPEVLFLDIGLPGMNGYEVTKRLRQEPGLEKATFVAVTGYGQEMDRERSQSAGFQVHLVKPIDQESINEVLSRAAAS